MALENAVEFFDVAGRQSIGAASGPDADSSDRDIGRPGAAVSNVSVLATTTFRPLPDPTWHNSSFEDAIMLKRLKAQCSECQELSECEVLKEVSAPTSGGSLSEQLGHGAARQKRTFRCPKCGAIFTNR